MKRRRHVLALIASGILGAGGVFAATDLATPSSGPSLTGVPNANTRSDGYSPASKLSPQLSQTLVAQGSTALENTSPLTSYYGYYNDLLNAAGQPQMVPTPTSPAAEAHKTEPDKNTCLVFKHGLEGADPGYDYGTHFLFQGHEGGTGGAGYITRINLDADAQHRVTLLATTDAGGHPLATIDGSTWDPWAKRLLFTTENAGAPTYAATPDYPSTVTDVSGALGRGGPSASIGTLTMFYKGDEAHTGLDNVAFLSRTSISFVEDAGDTLHGQRNALDSGFVWNVGADYSKAANQPVRWLAEGRDSAATLDAASGGFGKNDGDNEITGLYVSDGNTGTDGVLGEEAPDLGSSRWRWFYTRQHGDNRTYEVVVKHGRD